MTFSVNDYVEVTINTDNIRKFFGRILGILEPRHISPYPYQVSLFTGGEMPVAKWELRKLTDEEAMIRKLEL